MATVIIIVGAGDGESGHYSIHPGGHLDPYINPSYAIAVGTASEITFTITPDEGYLIGDVFTSWPEHPYPISIGAVSSHTFINLQDPNAPTTQWIYAYAIPAPAITPISGSFPWWALALAGVAGLIIGKGWGK